MSSPSKNSFSSSAFYGIKSRKRRYEIKTLIERRLKTHSKLYIPQDYKPRLRGPSSSWKVYYKQKDAFMCARRTSEDLHVFAFEKNNVVGEEKGQRMYLVTSYPVFWHYYRQLKSDKRHHYEIIPEGSVCKLYFDLEYVKELNPDNNGSHMVQILIKYVCYWLKKMYKINCQRSDIVILDSSTDKKFSRHLIFQMKEAVFKDNLEVGYFVHDILNKVKDIINQSENLSDSGIEIASDDNADLGSKSLEQISSIQNRVEKTDVSSNEKQEIENFAPDILKEFSLLDLQSLSIKNKHGADVFFVDTGVYTKNRNFRLYLSSKLGKLNPLVLSHDDLTRQDFTGEIRNNTEDEEKIFMASLISNVLYSDKIRILSCEKTVRNNQLVDNKNTAPRTNEETIEGSKSSPYLEIDKYISNMINGDNKDGYIRRWTYFTSGELLIYDIAKYRWCENIGRQHRSNNIMLIVDMKKGVYYQKCHDPDCKNQGFKSNDRDIPREILPAFYLEEDELFDSDIEDEELLLAADQLANSACSSEYNKTTSVDVEDLSDTQLLHLTAELEHSNT